MAKVLQIVNGQVEIGFDNGDLKTFSLEHFNFSVQPGDEVDIFENSEKIIINKKQVAANNAPTAATSSKSKVVAGLLAILLPWFGIHNFYLGKTGKAVAMLIMDIIGILTLFFLIGFLLLVVVGVWSFIEGILILTAKPGSEWHRDGNGLELS